MNFKQNVIVLVTWCVVINNVNSKGTILQNKLDRINRIIFHPNGDHAHPFCTPCTVKCSSGYVKASRGCYLCTCATSSTTIQVNHTTTQQISTTLKMHVTTIKPHSDIPPTPSSVSKAPQTITSSLPTDTPNTTTTTPPITTQTSPTTTGTPHTSYKTPPTPTKIPSTTTKVPPTIAQTPPTTTNTTITITKKPPTSTKTSSTTSIIPSTIPKTPPTPSFQHPEITVYYKLTDPCIPHQVYCSRQCGGSYVKGPGGCEYCLCMDKYPLDLYLTTSPAPFPDRFNTSQTTTPTPSPEVCIIAKVICNEKCPNGFTSHKNDCLYCACDMSDTTADTGNGLAVYINILNKPCVQNINECQVRCPKGYLEGPRGCKFCTCN